MNWRKYHPPAEAAEILAGCPSLLIVDSVAQLVNLACSDVESHGFEASYEVAGRRVDQANLLLRQFEEHTRMQYILCPNQHIGAWKVGFMPQWIARDYLARRGGAPFRAEQIRPARCPLLGSALHQLQVEGRAVARWFLQVDTQPEVGEAGYDAGAEILSEFFRQCVAEFREPDLAPLGRQIIDCCLDGGTVKEYEALIRAETSILP